jgi:hypothetical protein
LASLAAFFTVVEFPVLGYVPPVILTELHFLLEQSAVELAPPSAAPASAALCIGIIWYHPVPSLVSYKLMG